MQSAPDMNEVPVAARRAALALLARATEPELSRPLAQFWPDLPVRVLRKPEIGLVMVRGRIGSDGAAFNLGEATVTRAVVELPGGQRGYGQMLGREARLARMAAGKIDAVDMEPCVARFLLAWNQLGVNKAP